LCSHRGCGMTSWKNIHLSTSISPVSSSGGKREGFSLNHFRILMNHGDHTKVSLSRSAHRYSPRCFIPWMCDLKVMKAHFGVSSIESRGRRVDADFADQVSP